MTKPQIFIQTATDPFLNLATEKYLYTHYAEKAPLLYLWCNSPCVVIGRAQNPWIECNLDIMQKNNIPLMRRHSGGGTVFHDINNLNFSFLSAPEYYDKKLHLTIITEALKTLDISTIISPRNDILLPLHGKNYKISGSAYRESRLKSLHHATLLIDTDIELLNQSIHSKEKDIDAKGVRSVRSEVITLRHIKPELKKEDIIKSISNQFKLQYPDTETNILDNEIYQNNEIIEEAERLQSWQSRFGKTLPFNKLFTIDNKNYIVTVKQGKIESIEMPNQENLTFKQPLIFKNKISQLIALLNPYNS